MVKEAFSTNPHKASAKVNINSFMIGSLFFILTLVISIDPYKFGIVAISQLVLAIPLLFVSSLAYAKIGYWKETKRWDRLGWFTNNIGNLFTLNAIGIITNTFNHLLAIVYFSLFLLLMLIYSYLNGYQDPSAIKEKLFKFLFLLLIISTGGLVPILI